LYYVEKVFNDNHIYIRDTRDLVLECYTLSDLKEFFIEYNVKIEGFKGTYAVENTCFRLRNKGSLIGEFCISNDLEYSSFYKLSKSVPLDFKSIKDWVKSRRIFTCARDIDEFFKSIGVSQMRIFYLEEIRIISQFDENSSANPYTALMNAVKNRYIYILRYMTFLSLTVSSYEDLDGEYYDDIDFNLCRSIIQKSLDSFRSSDREFIELYFGFDGNKPLTEKQIATKWGVTYSRVNQIKNNIIRKLRKRMFKNKKSLKDISNESYIKIND